MATDPAPRTWTAPPPFSVDGLLDGLHSDICDEFDDADAFADEMFAKAEAKKERLDELMTAAWSTFAAEAGLTREFATEEE